MPSLNPPYNAIYDRIPQLLVFDIDQELTAFFEETCDMDHFEYSIDMIISEALLYISDLNYLEDGFGALGRELAMCHGPDNGYAQHHTDVICAATVKLARGMHAKFMLLGAYLPDGTLPFQFLKFINHRSYTPTPVLERCLEYLP